MAIKGWSIFKIKLNSNKKEEANFRYTEHLGINQHIYK